jgi:hypothetical protein
LLAEKEMQTNATTATHQKYTTAAATPMTPVYDDGVQPAAKKVGDVCMAAKGWNVFWLQLRYDDAVATASGRHFRQIARKAVLTVVQTSSWQK